MSLDAAFLFCICTGVSIFEIFDQNTFKKTMARLPRLKNPLNLFVSIEDRLSFLEYKCNRVLKDIID